MAGKDLRKAVRGLGPYITGKEVKKVSEEFNTNKLAIAQLASKFASENNSTVSFSSKLANSLSKLASQILGPSTAYESGRNTGMGGNSLFDILGQLRTRNSILDLGIKDTQENRKFIENISQAPKSSKGQMLTIGRKGAGSLLPKEVTRDGGGNKKGGGGKQAQPEVSQEAAYADLLGQFLGEGFGMIGDTVGGALAGMSAADKANMRQMNRTTRQMTQLFNNAIETANQPVEMPTINIPEPIVLSSPGDNYNISGVRAPRRTQSRRTDYLRNNMYIGGGNIAPSLMSAPAGGLGF